MSKWRSVTRDVPEGFVLGKVLFEISSKDRNSGTEITLRKFTDTTKLYGAVDMPEGWNAIQRNLDKFEKGACAKLINPKKAKCWCCTRVQAALVSTQAGDEQMQSSPAEKALGCWWMRGWT